MTQKRVLVAGGGIGGLAAALALSRAGLPIELFEQAGAFSEVGAGLQLGPNAVRVLNDWGLLGALKAVAAFPDALEVRDAHAGNSLGRLTLGASFERRYGQPYATLHRADLHGLLLGAVRAHSGAQLNLDQRVRSYAEAPDGVDVMGENGLTRHGVALVGCDGLWSRVRSQMLGFVPVRASGHLAYRGMVRACDLPLALRAPVVTAWLGPRLHVVHYPVRAGEWFNVVAVVHGVLGQGHGGAEGSDPQSWTHGALATDLRRALGPASSALLAMVDLVPAWTLWALNDRPPIAGAHELARGRVALLGDAAHPLRPYLAQGAAMALEDAWALGQLIEQADLAGKNGVLDWPSILQRYAHNRWERNARVQARSARNGRIFHAQGPVRWARNMAMAALGESLLDNPWLYEGPQQPLP